MEEHCFAEKHKINQEKILFFAKMLIFIDIWGTNLKIGNFAK